MTRRAMYALLSLLLLAGQAAAQEKITTAVRDAKIGRTDEITLELGQWHVFSFELTKPFTIESESLFSTVEPPIYQDKTGKALVVFGAADAPQQVVVRVIQDNKTAYRALVTINSKPTPPKPSPYITRLQAAFSKDAGATAADLDVLARLYDTLTLQASTAATGKDIWDAISKSYIPFGSTLKETRREIGVILGETTTQYYSQPLDATARRVFATVLRDIRNAVLQLKEQPAPQPPTPVSKGPYFVVVVKEATKQTPEEAAVYNDGKLQDYLKSNGHRWLVIDQDVTGKDGVPPVLLPYLALAKGKALPWAIVVDLKTGKRITDAAMPTSTDKVIELLNKLGGK